ncbi:MAG: hypothetical protein Kow00121_59000 [Elainellaceae cyanobacterium]
MFNRIGAVAASATLITVGTLTASMAAVINSEANLNANQVSYGQAYSATSSLDDRSNLILSPTSPELNQPVALFCYIC